MKVEVIGHEQRIVELVKMSVSLRWPDATTLMAATADEGLRLIHTESPNLVVLYAHLPGDNPSHIIRTLRQYSSVPLLVLGEQSKDIDVITALTLGADDYVRLPCEMLELMARIWAVARRAGPLAEEWETPLSYGDLIVDASTYEVFLGDRRVRLSLSEYRLLLIMVKNRGRVVSRQALEQAIWGDNVDADGLLKKHVQRLRQALGDHASQPHWIATIRGVGYRFVGPLARELTIK